MTAAELTRHDLILIAVTIVALLAAEFFWSFLFELIKRYREHKRESAEVQTRPDAVTVLHGRSVDGQATELQRPCIEIILSGPAGSGKTTLARAIRRGLEPQDRARVRFYETMQRIDLSRIGVDVA